MMTRERAMRIINNEITFHPMWKISAELRLYDALFGGNTFGLRFAYGSVETNFLPDSVEPVDIDMTATFEFDPYWSEQDLLRAVLNTALLIQEHEAREMFKVNGVGVFNPHRLDGNEAWDNTAKVTQTLVTSSA
jgi:hypothetical protein